MKYSVTCDCGKALPVSATQAGATLTCECGKDVFVPSMSELRKSVGENSVPQNSIQKIRAMVRNGELPTDNMCPLTGERPDTTLKLYIQCERSWKIRVISNDDVVDADKAVALLLMPKLLSLYFFVRDLTRKKNYEKLGRDTALMVPLRIASKNLPPLRGVRRWKKIKKILRQSPICAEFLKEYPRAKLIRIETSLDKS
jgi:hypothetical protein